MELSSKYSPAEIEGKWYDYWLRHKIFHSEPDAREPFTVVIPPPNVTGVLHMGHVLNETIQDILVRHARQQGKNACWVPGTDHASIATEAKVVNRLAQQGISKKDLTREEFLKHAWAWTEEHGGIILKQLRRLGCSCDWDRTAFTMDRKRSQSVIKVFCDLYDKGLIYRGVRMVNWDPKALTALSDEEVIFKEHQGKLYYLRYMVKEEPGKYAIVATTRPETIMGDTAMCINPNDPKNAWLKGKHVVVPLVGREIPVIEDDYVDVEFGTGCLKVTPAHDINDYMLGEKHHLQSIDIFNDNGTLSSAAGLYVGMDRFEVREQIEKDLIAANLMEKVEDYTNNVGCSERTGVPIEPKLSTQWFLKMEHLAQIALDPVMNDDIVFYPQKYKNTYRHWLENIKDWCISRQLWWGHRIPAYYIEQGARSKEQGVNFVVAETAEQALAKARALTGNDTLQLSDLRQDPDCLDTWFSSWLWPISLFDGINNPGNEEIKYYYPTADLVTGPDIIFFWVARMIMAGYEYEKTMPFKHVYFTGIVRDKLGRKMSKSLGNSPDPLELIDKYGADGVRMGMMLSAPAGNDILFDETLCEQGRNFCGKIWNAFRLIKSWNVDENIEPTNAQRDANRWMFQKIETTMVEVEDLMSKYRLSEALTVLYRLFRDEFSGWYLEAIKPEYGKPQDMETYYGALHCLDILLRALHPFMPFITEHLWQALNEREDGETISLHAPYIYGEKTTAENITASKQFLEDFEVTKQIVTGVRNIRAQKNIAQKVVLKLQAVGVDEVPFADVVMKLAGVESIEMVSEKDPAAISFLAGNSEYAVPLGDVIDNDEEILKLTKELEYMEGFLASVNKKLSNERFVQNAKPEIVDNERKKQSDAEQKIAALRASIEALKK
ncbi:MAG TPA: valine--tRNA ligase [Bacteroidales bacterium]|nr:valine--tRNA ligase [Bacteroidales bacterium]